jgi:membrane-associated phospholipid phosphatase
LIEVKTIFRKNSIFLIPYLVFIVFGAVLIILNTKTETHLEFNRFHNSFFDKFFEYATYLGDGYIVTLAVIILLAIRFRFAILVGVSNIVASLITQLLKHTVFSEVVRPKKFFEGLHDIYLVPDVENYLYNSFPSGHSTCAFALYFSISLIVNDKRLKVLCLVMAFIVGYSRIYLSQHFFEDVYAGSVIGVISTYITYMFTWDKNTTWLNRSLLSLKKTM